MKSKFEVKVGWSFEVKVRNEKALATKVAKKQPARSNSLKEVASVAVVAAVAGILLGTAIYGFFTGDFSVMEHVWEAIKTFIPGVVKHYFG